MLIVALRGAGRLMTANREGVFYLRLTVGAGVAAGAGAGVFVAAGFVVPPEVEVPVLGFSVLVGSLVVLSFLSVFSAGVAVGAGVASVQVWQLLPVFPEPQPDFGSWSHPNSSYRWCFFFSCSRSKKPQP